MNSLCRLGALLPLVIPLYYIKPLEQGKTRNARQLVFLLREPRSSTAYQIITDSTLGHASERHWAKLLREPTPDAKPGRTSEEIGKVRRQSWNNASQATANPKLVEPCVDVTYRMRRAQETRKSRPGMTVAQVDITEAGPVTRARKDPQHTGRMMERPCKLNTEMRRGGLETTADFTMYPAGHDVWVITRRARTCMDGSCVGRELHDSTQVCQSLVLALLLPWLLYGVLLTNKSGAMRTKPG
jgi:hypothetical protein